jgi:hypothetical protein
LPARWEHGWRVSWTASSCAVTGRFYFYRAGLIEKWGRGTNRVVDMCKAAGLRPPEFEEITGAAVVRFRVNVLGPGRASVTESGQSCAGVADPVADPVNRPS